MYIVEKEIIMGIIAFLNLNIVRLGIVALTMLLLFYAGCSFEAQAQSLTKEQIDVICDFDVTPIQREKMAVALALKSQGFGKFRIGTIFNEGVPGYGHTREARLIHELLDTDATTVDEGLAIMKATCSKAYAQYRK